MHCLERLISARLSEMQLLSAPGEQAARKGRHGPIAARMSKRNVYGGRLTISASDDRLEALDEYVTCRSRAGVSAGKWMFEVLVRSSGLLQVCSLSCSRPSNSTQQPPAMVKQLVFSCSNSRPSRRAEAPS